MACLVLAAQGRIDYKTFVFSNVGDDSEHPATLQYLEEFAKPFAELHGLTLHVVDRVKRDGTKETLYQRLTKEGSRSLPIPVRMNETGAPGTRSCTADFKIRVIAKWQKQHGATKDNPAMVGVGISIDEINRMRTDSQIPHQVLDYPLIELRLSRDDCKEIIRQAGIPVPPKSSCYFCPFHTMPVWWTMRENEPDLFQKSADLEKLLNDRRQMLGKDPVWLTRMRMPLDQAVDVWMQQQKDKWAKRWGNKHDAARGQMLMFQPTIEIDEERHSCGPFVCSVG